MFDIGPFKKGAVHVLSASSDAATFVSNVEKKYITIWLGNDIVLDVLTCHIHLHLKEKIIKDA